MYIRTQSDSSDSSTNTNTSKASSSSTNSKSSAVHNKRPSSPLSNKRKQQKLHFLQKNLLSEISQTHRIITPLSSHPSSLTLTTKYQAINESTGKLCSVWAVPLANSNQLLQLHSHYSAMVKYHANRRLPKFHEIHHTSSHAVLSWEYCPNGSAFSLAHSTTDGLSEHVALGLVRDVLNALVYLHEDGQEHGDIRPSNMRISARGTVKLHGLMLDREQFAPKQIEYSAPEIVLGQKIWDSRACDMWSLGITLYVLLTRSLRFSNSKYFKMCKVSGHLKADADSLLRSDALNSISKGCRMLINGLLRIEPDERLTAGQALSMCTLALSRLNHR